MKFVLHPWQLLLLALAASLNRQQQQTIEYLITENQILKEKLVKKRILLNDNQRRRLAVKGKILGRKLLLQIANIACPDTILRWHNRLVAEKWDYSDRRKKVGRPRLGRALVDLVVRLAKENPTWGYERIEGALKNLRYRISSSSIGNILKAHGIEPAVTPKNSIQRSRKPIRAGSGGMFERPSRQAMRNSTRMSGPAVVQGWIEYRCAQLG